MKQKSYYIKAKEIDKKWILIDAKDQILGRVATKIALSLMGKTKPTFTPGMQMGDFVIVTNVEKIRVTGNKETDKMYYHHTGFAGGLKAIAYKDLKKKMPEKILRTAVLGMLPKNKLRAKLICNLKIYSGEKHPHEAQKPVLVNNKCAEIVIKEEINA
ncbi:MAG: 50S ribosomal protein L13 [Candidatus Margulisiibacteriota bacterium]